MRQKVDCHSWARGPFLCPCLIGLTLVFFPSLVFLQASYTWAESRAGNDKVSSRKKARQDETVSISSRLVTPSRETVSNWFFCFEKKITLKTAKFGGIFGPIFLLSLVSSLVTFWSRDGTDETVSCLVSSRDLPSRSRLVLRLSSRYRP